ncbi:MAG: hypothetical protein IPK88_16860 [Saprospiraceae bacterium]|nr:hypothetical protein [Candidatus Defluviibacterium haderslevense]
MNKEYNSPNEDKRNIKSPIKSFISKTSITIVGSVVATIILYLLKLHPRVSDDASTINYNQFDGIVNNFIDIKTMVDTGSLIRRQVDNNNSKPINESSKQNFSKKEFTTNLEKSPVIHQYNKNIQANNNSIGPVENYEKYVNGNRAKASIAVIIVDDTNKFLLSPSEQIENLYKTKSYTVYTRLFNSSFFAIPDFSDLIGGNYKVLDKFNLSRYTNYIVIGSLHSIYQPGQLNSSTLICNISMNVTIIDTSNNSIYRNFQVPTVIGNGVTSDQAYEKALFKLLNIYNSDYSII